MERNMQAMRELEAINRHFGNAKHGSVAGGVGTKDRYIAEHQRQIEQVIKKYGVKAEVVKEYANGIKEYRVLDAEGRLVVEYHGQ